MENKYTLKAILITKVFPLYGITVIVGDDVDNLKIRQNILLIETTDIGVYLITDDSKFTIDKKSVTFNGQTYKSDVDLSLVIDELYDISEGNMTNNDMLLYTNTVVSMDTGTLLIHPLFNYMEIGISSGETIKGIFTMDDTHIKVGDKVFAYDETSITDTDGKLLYKTNLLHLKRRIDGITFKNNILTMDNVQVKPIETKVLNTCRVFRTDDFTFTIFENYIYVIVNNDKHDLKHTDQNIFITSYEDITVKDNALIKKPTSTGTLLEAILNTVTEEEVNSEFGHLKDTTVGINSKDITLDDYLKGNFEGDVDMFAIDSISEQDITNFTKYLFNATDNAIFGITPFNALEKFYQGVVNAIENNADNSTIVYEILRLIKTTDAMIKGSDKSLEELVADNQDNTLFAAFVKFYTEVIDVVENSNGADELIIEISKAADVIYKDFISKGPLEAAEEVWSKQAKLFYNDIPEETTDKPDYSLDNVIRDIKDTDYSRKDDSSILDSGDSITVGPITMSQLVDIIRLTLKGEEPYEANFVVNNDILDTDKYLVILGDKDVTFLNKETDDTTTVDMDTSALKFRLETVGYTLNNELFGVIKRNGDIHYEFVEDAFENGFITKSYVVTTYNGDVLVKHKTSNHDAILPTTDDIKHLDIYNLSILDGATEVVLVIRDGMAMLFTENGSIQSVLIDKYTCRNGLNIKGDTLVYSSVDLHIPITLLDKKNTIVFTSETNMYIYNDGKLGYITTDEAMSLGTVVYQYISDDMMKTLLTYIG